MNNIVSKLSNLNLKEKRVFLRADLNVPLKKGKIIQDYRLTQILPTINQILKKGGKIILATHIDRPSQKDPNLSTRHLIHWFKKNGFKIEFEENLDKALIKSKKNLNTILLLENLRFFPGEKNSSKQFAKKLKALADIYVNDAFGLLHRPDTSITILPLMFSKENRTIGPLIEKELKFFSNFLKKLEKPFLLIIGGVKLQSKILLLKSLLNKVQSIILCPAIVFTFLKTQNKKTGKSLINKNLLNKAKEFLKEAKKNKVKIIFPKDYQIMQNGKLSFVKADDFPDDGIGLSIGPQSIIDFKEEIKSAKTILFNGAIGLWDKKDTLEAMGEILNAIANSKAKSVIVGGDATAAAELYTDPNKIDFLSTGGGAVLAFLSGQKLPGLNFIFEQA